MQPCTRILALFAALAGIALVTAANDETGSENHPRVVGWRPEPQGRGTWSLLVSCIVTLSLCVYTALHLDVAVNQSTGSRWFTKFRWVLLGILAPEVVAYHAWYQWESARRLTVEINGILEERTNSGESIQHPSRKHAWTIVHSFYAGMGGFAFDTDDHGEPPYIPKSPKALLTANGVLLLAKLGHLPDISKESIQDKSKADGFSKAFAVLQASWLVLQCIARLAAHLPLTALEVSTLAHVAFALITYALWWKKPLEIQDPTVLSGDWVRPLCASMWMFSHLERTFRHDAHVYRTREPEITELLWYPSDFTDMTTRDVPETFQMNGSGEIVRLPVNCDAERNYMVIIKAGEVLTGVGFGISTSSDRFRSQNLGDGTDGPVRWWTPRIEIPLDRTTVMRWRLMGRALSEYGHLVWDQYRESYGIGGNTTVWEYPSKNLTQDYLSLSVSTSQRDGSPALPNSGIPAITLSLATAIYGGLHLTCWNHHFPTADQALYWRLAAAYISGSGIVWSVFYWIWNRFVFPGGGSRNGRLPWIESGTGVFALVAIIAVLVCMFIGYLVARVYLPVESLICLKSLPAEAYDTPNWSQYLPHL